MFFKRLVTLVLATAVAFTSLPSSIVTATETEATPISFDAVIPHEIEETQTIGQKVIMNITSDAFSNWYKLPLDNSYMLNAELKFPSSCECGIYVYDFTGTQLFRLTGSDSRLVIPLLKGEYYLYVYCGGASGEPKGQMEYGIYPLDVDRNYQSFVERYDDMSTRNDTYAKASIIEVGKTYHGILGSQNPNDYYKITVGAGGAGIQYNLTFYNARGLADDTEFAILDENLKSLLHQLGNGLFYYTLKEGTYYLHLHRGADDDSSYEIVTTSLGTPESSFTVTFNTNGGSNVASQTVASGAAATKPAAPVKDGYTFGGWYQDSSLTTPWNFSSPVTNDMTLYARWEKQAAFTVTFDTNGGSSIASQTVSSGAVATKPADPVKAGYIFKGWYQDSTLTTAWNFSSPVTKDMTLYARWEKEVTYTVTFNTNGGSSIASQTVSSGGTVTRPADPVLSGYTFRGWYQDSALTTAWNFSSPVTKDMTLYAGWNITVDRTISVGRKTTLAVNKKIAKVSVSNKNIAKVKKKGKKVIVTGKTPGVITITAYNKKGRILGRWVIGVE